MLKEWKEYDDKVYIKNRNLGIINSTVADVRDDLLKIKINFNYSNDISLGGR